MTALSLFGVFIRGVQWVGQEITTEGVTSDPGLEPWAELREDEVIEAGPVVIDVEVITSEPPRRVPPKDVLGAKQRAMERARGAPEPSPVTEPGLPSWVVPVGALAAGGVLLTGLAGLGIFLATRR